MLYFRRVATVLIPAVLLLSACSPADDGGNTSGDGRARLSSSTSYAEFGNYVVHVNAMETVELTPEIAGTYGITRSEDRGLVNLVVLKKTSEPGMDKPVSGEVKLSAANLTGQVKEVGLREIRDGSSIYYIGDVPVENRETINFDFDIRPQDSDRVLRVRYSHQFYTR